MFFYILIKSRPHLEHKHKHTPNHKTMVRSLYANEDGFYLFQGFSNAILKKQK